MGISQICMAMPDEQAAWIGLTKPTDVVLEIPGDNQVFLVPTSQPEMQIHDGVVWRKFTGQATVSQINVWQKVGSVDSI